MNEQTFSSISLQKNNNTLSKSNDKDIQNNKDKNDREKIFILGESTNKYELYLKLIYNSIIFQIIPYKNGKKSYDIFINTLNLEGFKKINKIFGICDSIQDVFNYIKDIIEQKKADIKIINEKEINIILKANVMIKEEKIIIELFKKEADIKDLVNDINILKQENKELKERLEKLENYIFELDKINSLKGQKTFKELSEELITFPSKIIVDNDDILLILRKFDGRDKKVKSVDLLFRASRDGDKLENIKNALNEKINVLAVAKTTKGRKFAGFTEKGYNLKKNLGDDKKAFLISFDNYRVYDYEEYNLDYNIQNVFIHRNRNLYSAIEDNRCCPFYFQNNGNIFIPNNFFSNNCMIQKVEYSRWNRIIELNANEENFNIKELEYFQIHFKE